MDSFTANLALDKYIKNKDFTSAARTATLLMLQEDFENPITKFLSLYSCVKFLQNPQPFEDAPLEAVETPTTTTTTSSKKKKEEVKVRVRFIRNPYFDGHFDLKSPEELVGKTLCLIGNLLEKGTLSNSTKLLGLINFKKYENASKLLAEIGTDLHKDAVDLIAASLEKSPDQELESFTLIKEQMLTLNNASEQLNKENFEKALCDLANNAVSRNESNDIKQQCQVNIL